MRDDDAGLGHDEVTGRDRRTARRLAGCGGFLVLLDDAASDAPAVADRDALVFRPRADPGAALAAGGGARRPGGRFAAGLAGPADERCELAAERGGVARVQVDLVLGAAQTKAHRLVCRTAFKIVFKRDSGPGCHHDPSEYDARVSPYTPKIAMRFSSAASGTLVRNGSGRRPALHPLWARDPASAVCLSKGPAFATSPATAPVALLAAFVPLWDRACGRGSGGTIGLGETHDLACRRRHRCGSGHRCATGRRAKSGVTAAAWASRRASRASAFCARRRETDKRRRRPGCDRDHA